MGRFKTWIDRVTSARRQRRSVAAPRARRPLRFEQFESRLALSAAAATEPSLAPTDLVRDRGEFLMTLWEGTPGSSQWGEVSFAVPQNVRTLTAEWSNSPTVGERLKTFNFESLRESIHVEGGFITSDSLQQFATIASAAVGRSAPFDGNPVNGNTFDLIGHVLDSADVSGIYIDPAPSSFDRPWGSGKNSPFDLGEGLNGAGADGGGAGADDANVTLIESPVLRITAPMPEANDEGGAIDVTAMVAPRTHIAAYSTTAAAMTGSGRAVMGLATDAKAIAKRASAESANADELRARAVVYEVSLAHEVSDESDEKTRAERTPAKAESPAAPITPHASEVAPPTAAVRTEGDISADGATPDAAGGDAAMSRQSSALDQNRTGERDQLAAHAARDAALARLGAEASVRPAADLDTASSRTQTLGMVLVAAVTAAPVVKRMRRGRSTKIAEQASGLQ